MSYPFVEAYVSGTAFTDSSGGKYQGDWQRDIMAPVLTAATTTNQNKLGVVDGQGRVTSLLPSAARTATPATGTLDSRGATGLIVRMNATAVTATPSVVVTIDGYDASAAGWYNILTSTAIATAVATTLSVFPGATVTANVSANATIPDKLRVVCTHGDADSITYSVNLEWIP